MPFFYLLGVPAILATLIAISAPALAQNNRVVRSGNWYEDRANAVTSTATELVLKFAQAPTDKFLNITRVFCAINTYGTQALGDVILDAATTSNATSANLGRGQSLRGMMSEQQAYGSKYFSITATSYLKLGPGRYPVITIQAPIDSGSNRFINGNCTIVGELSND